VTAWRIKFLKHYLGFEPGDVVMLHEDYAKVLCTRGFAEPTTDVLSVSENKEDNKDVD